MSEQKQLSDTIREIGFPMLIAITALLLVLISGIVNYRQNNLASIESGLRDTRDQLQLAKNDIADMKVRTLQQLVEAELTIRNRDRLLDEKDELTDKLSDANSRIKELEQQVKELDRALESTKKQLTKSTKTNSTKTSKKRAVKKIVKSIAKAPVQAVSKPQVTAVTPPASLQATAKPQAAEKAPSPQDAPVIKKAESSEKKPVDQPGVEKVAVTSDKEAAVEELKSLEKVSDTTTEKPSEALADLDIFTKNITTSLQQSIAQTLGKSGFKAKFPEKRKTMKMTKETTVFYYDKSYKPVAEQLVKNLSDITKGKVILRKGASPFNANKIITHIIAE